MKMSTHSPRGSAYAGLWVDTWSSIVALDCRHKQDCNHDFSCGIALRTGQRKRIPKSMPAALESRFPLISYTPKEHTGQEGGGVNWP